MLTRSSAATGTSRMLAKVGRPSIEAALGLTGKTSQPSRRYARTALLPYLWRCVLAPMIAMVGFMAQHPKSEGRNLQFALGVHCFPMQIATVGCVFEFAADGAQ